MRETDKPSRYRGLQLSCPVVKTRNLHTLHIKEEVELTECTCIASETKWRILT
jgi:hypothetical protein